MPHQKVWTVLQSKHRRPNVFEGCYCTNNLDYSFLLSVARDTCTVRVKHNYICLGRKSHCEMKVSCIRTQHIIYLGRNECCVLYDRTTQLCTWVKGGTMRAKCFVKGHVAVIQLPVKRGTMRVNCSLQELNIL